MCEKECEDRPSLIVLRYMIGADAVECFGLAKFCLIAVETINNSIWKNHHTSFVTFGHDKTLVLQDISEFYSLPFLFNINVKSLAEVICKQGVRGCTIQYHQLMMILNCTLLVQFTQVMLFFLNICRLWKSIWGRTSFDWP